MKRTILGILGAVLVGVGLVWALQAQDQQATKAPAAQPPASSVQASPTSQGAPAASAQKVAHSFTDDAEMKQFTQLWQVHQAVVIRMNVLQAYLDQEKSNLAQTNEQLLSKFSVDVNKNYTFDGEHKQLFERETPPQPTAGQSVQSTKTESASKP